MSQSVTDNRKPTITHVSRQEFHQIPQRSPLGQQKSKMRPFFTSALQTHREKTSPPWKHDSGLFDDLKHNEPLRPTTVSSEGQFRVEYFTPEDS